MNTSMDAAPAAEPTVFIDRDGVVQNITIGEMSPSQIENQIQRVVR